jgi:hypothetical protein
MDNKTDMDNKTTDTAVAFFSGVWAWLRETTTSLLGFLWMILKEIGTLKIFKWLSLGVVALIIAWAGWKYYSVETYAVCIKMDDKGKTQDMTKPMKLTSKAHEKIAKTLTDKDWVCEEYKVDMEMIDLLNTMYISHTEIMRSKVTEETP